MSLALHDDAVEFRVAAPGEPVRRGDELPADWAEWTEAEFDAHFAWATGGESARVTLAGLGVERPGPSLFDERLAHYARYGVER